MDRMTFIGVSTASSSIMSIFPRWAEHLGIDATLEGEDLPLDATRAQYRASVAALRDATDRVGALVTTHKMALFSGAHDLFDDLDDFARACGEISSIAKRDGSLLGRARDPLTARLALDEFFPADGFGSTRDAIVLGAGGAGLALTWYLAEREDAPRRIVVTDTDASRLAHLADVHRTRGTDASLLDLRLANDDAVRGALAAASAGSLVVNASGLGKDRPGSPLPADTAFPEGARVWEFNYRGSLEFLAQAREQESSARLTIVDGWRYFIHGWTQVIADVFDVPMPPETVEALAALAER